MSHLWVPAEEDGWSVMLLETDKSYEARWDGDGPLRCAAAEGKGEGLSVITRAGDGKNETWVVVGGTDAGKIYINGMALRGAGLWVLHHQDEIRFGRRGRVFYSTEVLATVTVFRDTGAQIRCARCRGELESGTRAVRCPTCKVWHHEREDRPCWTYGPRCGNPFCSQSTVESGFRWTPEGL